MGGAVNEIKVGLTVVAAVVMAVLAYVVLHEVMILRESTIYFARYDTSRGAQSGAVVELNGNAVGKMVGAELVEEGRGSLVKFRIRKDVMLYKDYLFVISQDDLFGEKFIDIEDPQWHRKTREVADGTREIAPEGFTFRGVNRAGIANMLAGAISETLQQAGETLGIESVQQSMEEVTTGLSTTLGNVNRLVLNLNDIVEGSEGYVTGSMANVHGMSKNLLAMSADLSQASAELAALATDPQQRDRLDVIVRNVEQASASLNGLAASLDGLVGDPALQQDVKDSVRLTKESSGFRIPWTRSMRHWTVPTP
jgi:phospholipid/cholesterol/gamma-HCH transport system substrate-binding protein